MSRYDCFLSTVESAAAWSHEAVMTNMGQCCVAGSRTFVHEKIYDKFVAKSRELAQQRTYGDPYEMTTKNGPQVRYSVRFGVFFFTGVSSWSSMRREYFCSLIEVKSLCIL